MMAGHGNPPPRYTLYVRKRDGMMRMTHLGVIVAIAHWHAVNYSIGAGVCVTPIGAKGVVIFEDEYCMVEEFPVCKGTGGSGGKTTQKLVAIAKTPALVA